MKKIIGLVLIMVLCVSMMACGTNASNKEVDNENIVNNQDNTENKADENKKEENETVEVELVKDGKLTREGLNAKQVFNFNDVEIVLNETTYGDIKERISIKNFEYLKNSKVSSFDMVVTKIDNVEMPEDNHLYFFLVTPVKGTIPENIDEYVITGVEFNFDKDSNMNFAINGVQFEINCDDIDAYDKHFMNKEKVNITYDENQDVYFNAEYDDFWEGWYIKCYNLKMPYSFFDKIVVGNEIDVNKYDFNFTNNPNKEKINIGQIKINGEVFNLKDMTIRDFLNKDYIFSNVYQFLEKDFFVEPEFTSTVTLHVICENGFVYPIDFVVKNMTSEVQNAIDCKISCIDVCWNDLARIEEKGYLEFGDGIFADKMRYTVDEIVAMFGEPIEKHNNDDYTTYYYREEGKAGFAIGFYDDIDDGLLLYDLRIFIE